MTIEIQKPEIEALILDRMRQGAFQSIEDVLLQALKSTSPSAVLRADRTQALTGADLVEAMQASPCKEIGLEPERGPLPARSVRHRQ